MSRAICNDKAVSNTGLVGITDTFAINKQGRRMPQIKVCWRERKHRVRSKTVCYGRERTREEALEVARTLRAAGIAEREAWERQCEQRRRAKS